MTPTNHHLSSLKLVLKYSQSAHRIHQSDPRVPKSDPRPQSTSKVSPGYLQSNPIVRPQFWITSIKLCEAVDISGKSVWYKIYSCKGRPEEFHETERERERQRHGDIQRHRAPTGWDPKLAPVTYL